MRLRFWSLTCAWLSSRWRLHPGSAKLVGLSETNVLLLIAFALAPDGGFSVIILPPLIVQGRQLSLQFLVLCARVALWGFLTIGPPKFAPNAPTQHQVVLGPQSREAIPELP